MSYLFATHEYGSDTAEDADKFTKKAFTEPSTGAAFGEQERPYTLSEILNKDFESTNFFALNFLSEDGEGQYLEIKNCFQEMDCEDFVSFRWE